MFVAGNILYGIFTLKNTTKHKYSIILHVDNGLCILATYTTSQERSGVPNPTHGKNPKSGVPVSYVFKAGISIGKCPQNNDFAFKLDTVVVSDYGFIESSIECFKKSVSGLTLVCSLYNKEYLDLIYTLYQCRRTPKEYKKIFENILSEKTN